MAAAHHRANIRPLIVLGALLLTALPAFAQPQVAGEWSLVAQWPDVAIHAHVLPTGKVLFNSVDDNGRIWDPATNTFAPAGLAGFNYFCGGHSFLADGRLLITGGHVASLVGLPHATIYDPFRGTWTRLPDMNDARWYPTNTTLGNGDVLVTAGTIDSAQGSNKLPQVWQAATNTWRDLTTAQISLDLYPWLHVIPDGRVVNTGPFATTRVLDPSGTGSWTVLTQSSFGYRDYGSSVMYEPGKVLIVGGGTPTATSEVIDLNVASPAWRTVGSMAVARRQMNATLLPDGSVLATGGTSGPGFNNYDFAVQAAEMWSPVTETWTTMASYAGWPPTFRGYHSTALLLPDGRVLSAGGDSRPTAEIYSPPYLFKGPRPTVGQVPASVTYGQTFTITSPGSGSIDQVTWIRLSSVTHAYNMEQRFARLPFTRVPGGLEVTAPTNPNVSPPGFYLLFVLNNAGVPSIGAIVKIGTAANVPPAAPTNPAVTGVSATGVDLTWQDASNNELGFAIERCQGLACANFVEIARVAPGVTTFADSALTHATVYVYRVRAFNSTGNSPYAVAVTATTADPPQPEAPTDLSLEAIAVDSIVLRWVDHSTLEDGVKIERCQGETCTAFQQIAQVGPDATTFTDTGLAASTFYRYRLRAFASSGHSPYSSNATAATLAPPPGAPSALTATLTSPTLVRLAWADQSASEQGFTIERCGGAGCLGFAVVGQVAASVTTYSDSSLQPGGIYRYRVRAFGTAGNSPYSNVADATTPPAVPATVSATVVSASAISLSWTDVEGDTGFRIERCTGAGCTAFVQVGQAATNATTYENTGLTSGTTYRYRLRAFNAGGPSEPSSTADITTPPPSGPGNLTATAVSSSQINLAWVAAGFETGFYIERCIGPGCINFSQITQVGGGVTTFVSSGLSPSSTVRYRVRGFKGAAPSAYSNTAEATTPPPAPAGLVVTAMSATQMSLRWSDVVGDTGVRIERCAGAACATFAAAGEVAGNIATFIDGGVAAATLYRYRLRAFNAGGNSVPSNIVEMTTQPNAPTAMTATTVSPSQINLAWAGAGGESGFRVERCSGAGCTAFAQIVQTAPKVTTFVNASLPPGALYRYRVRAFTLGGQSGYSNTVEATTAPATPASLVATALSATQVSLRWNDVAGDTGVRVERCAGSACATFAPVGQVAGNVATFTDSGTTAATLYRYRVRAFNTGGDSLPSNISEVTTPPNAPTTMTATTVSPTQINLTWAAAGAGSGFRIERCSGAGCTAFSQIVQTAPNVTSYANAALSPGVLYRYRVRAFAATSLSGYSNTPEATTAPSTPGGLVATAVSPTQISLRWNDVPGDTGVRIERCAGVACATFAAVGQVAGNVATFTDSGGTAATLYRYRVRAFNTGGDSLPSNIADMTTQPNAPTTLTATIVSATQVNLAWAATGGESGFRIERCSPAGCTALSQIGQTSANVTSYVNPSLSPATGYRYRVRAFTAGGQSAYSNTVDVTTIPATPAGLIVTAISATQISLRWNDVAGDLGVRIERCAGAACTNFAAVGQVAGNVLTFANSGVTAATVYRYRVRAFNAGGDSLPSNTVEAVSK